MKVEKKEKKSNDRECGEENEKAQLHITVYKLHNKQKNSLID